MVRNHPPTYPLTLPSSIVPSFPTTLSIHHFTTHPKSHQIERSSTELAIVRQFSILEMSSCITMKLILPSRPVHFFPSLPISFPFSLFFLLPSKHLSPHREPYIKLESSSMELAMLRHSSIPGMSSWITLKFLHLMVKKPTEWPHPLPNPPFPISFPPTLPLFLAPPSSHPLSDPTSNHTHSII